MEYRRLPEEYSMPPDEYKTAPEIFEPAPEVPPMTPEYTDMPTMYSRPQNVDPRSEAHRRKEKREIVRNLFTPVAAVIATLSIVFASFNYDLIGLDFLGHNKDDSPFDDIVVVSPTDETTIPEIPTEEVEYPTDSVEDTTEAPTEESTEAATLPDLLSYPEGWIPDAEEQIWTQYYVLHPNPDEENFTSSLSLEDPIGEVKKWLKSWGGSRKYMEELDRTREFLGYSISDDAIISGSLDSPERMQLLGGHIYAVYKEVITYQSFLNSHGPGYYEFGDSAFPLLSNLAPDFAGVYAGDVYGPEEFIRFIVNDERQYRYLHMGAAWTNPILGSNELGEVEGASYDESTNVLTLENCTADSLGVNLMGNGFTIKLIGENHIGQITIWGYHYGGSVTFTGSGTLIINEDQSYSYGLYLDGEFSQSALLVDKGVDMEISGSEAAIMISATSMEKAIWFLENETLMSGGVRYGGEFLQYTTLVGDEEQGYSYAPITFAEIKEKSGIDFYDYTVVVPDGSWATYVEFESRLIED